MSTDRIDRLHIRTQQLSALTFVMTEEAFGDYNPEQQESIRFLVDELAADVKGLAHGSDDEADQPASDNEQPISPYRVSLLVDAAHEINTLAASVLRATHTIDDEEVRDALERAAASRIRTLADIVVSCGERDFDRRTDTELAQAFIGYLPHEGGAAGAGS